MGGKGKESADNGSGRAERGRQGEASSGEEAGMAGRGSPVAADDVYYYNWRLKRQERSGYRERRGGQQAQAGA